MNDRTTRVIDEVRGIFKTEGVNQMSAPEIFKKLQTGMQSGMKIKMEELMEVLGHYKTLDIIFIDAEQNVVFL